jgi:hypothetical protein
MTRFFEVALFAIVFALSDTARACSIPVFRYALDRWPADRYRLEISAPDAKDEGVARFLRNFTDSTPLNLSPARVPEEGPTRLDFPHISPGATPVWVGSLDAATLAQITDSPARAEITRRILAGETVVWLLVESGQREADEAAAAALEKRLRYLEQAAQLPAIDPADPSSQLGPGPALRVKFSLIRIRHGETSEQVFLKMLAGPKADPALANGPWFAAVFGRGRALGAWPAAGFGDEQIDEVSMFMIGACSCEVKRMNPGWDLLLNVDWDGELAKAEQARLAAHVAAGEAPPVRAMAVTPETVSIIPAAIANTPATPPSPNRRPLLLAAGVLLLAAFVLGLRRLSP